MRRACLLALTTLTALACKSEPTEAPAKKAKPAVAASQPASRPTKAVAKAPPPAHKPTKKPLLLTDDQRSAIDKGAPFNMKGFEGKWVQVTQVKGKWVIQQWCDAGTPTVTVDLSPEQPQLHIFLGQDADTISFDFALAMSAREAVVLERVETEYLEIARFEHVDDTGQLRFTREGKTERYVSEARRGDYEIVKEKCEAP